MATTTGVRPARLSSRRAKIAWPLAVALVVVLVLRVAVGTRRSSGSSVLGLSIGLALGAVILVVVGLVAEWRYHAARDKARATGLPFVMPTVLRHADLPGVGGWAGGMRTGAPLAGYLATDGTTLRWFPVRWTGIHKWAQPFTVDLQTVTGTDATTLTVGARTVPAVVFHLTGVSGPTDLTVGCSNWQKAGVEHSPLARYVSFT